MNFTDMAKAALADQAAVEESLQAERERARAQALAVRETQRGRLLAEVIPILSQAVEQLSKLDLPMAVTDNWTREDLGQKPRIEFKGIEGHIPNKMGGKTRFGSIVAAFDFADDGEIRVRVSRGEHSTHATDPIEGDSVQARAEAAVKAVVTDFIESRAKASRDR